MRACAHPIDRPAASFNPDEVISKIVQLLLDPRLSGFADGHNADDRRDPNSDPQDRENASHLVPEQCHNRRPEQCPVVQSHSPYCGKA